MSQTWYENLLDTAKDVAPTVAGGAATVISGGNIALGGIVKSIVGKVVGAGSDISPAGLEQAAKDILGDPDKLLEFRSRMREAEIRELEIRAKDVQNARGILQYSKGPVIISTLVVATFATLLYLVMFVAIPDESQAVAYVLMGSLATGFSQVLNFWLGTSVGSKEKDTTITKFADAAKESQAVRRARP